MMVNTENHKNTIHAPIFICLDIKQKDGEQNLALWDRRDIFLKLESRDWKSGSKDKHLDLHILCHELVVSA